MNKLILNRHFSDAYESTMQKIAGCCGGRGGQTMIMKRKGAKKKAKRRGR